MESNLSPVEAGASAYRVFNEALQREQFPAWETLGYDEQLRWVQVAKYGENALELFAGQPVADAAVPLCAIGGSDYTQVPAGQQVAWQAVTRHLAALLDGAEIEDLELAELSWREWAAGRLGAKQGV